MQINKTLLTIILNLILFSFFFFSKSAFALDPDKPISSYTHNVWYKEQGLPSSNILAISQTKDGYLWIGTFNGLARFDGVRFTVFNSGNTAEIKNDATWQLMEDNNGTLWVGTNGGGLVAYKDKQFKTYDTDNGLPSNIVTALCQDKTGKIWVGTRKGVCFFDPTFAEKGFTEIKLTDGSSFQDTKIIQLDPLGDVLISQYSSIYKVLSETNKSIATKILDFEFPVWSVYSDKLGNLWVGTRGEGLYKFKDYKVLNKYDVTNGLSSNIVAGFVEDKEGNFWIATDAGGLNRYTEKGFEVFTQKDGLSGNSIQSMCLDTEGSLWIGTYRNGLNRLQDSKFATVGKKQGLIGDTIWQTFQDTDSSLWICTSDGLSHIKDGKITNYTVDSPDKTIQTIIRDRQGTLWIGTRGKGICKFFPEATSDKQFISYTTKEGLPNNYVRSIVEDNSGNIWFGTPEGLCKISDSKITTYTTKDGLGLNPVLAIHKDSNGNLWIGTNGGGVSLLIGDKITATYTIKNGLASDVIFSFYEDKQGSIWITTNNGLTRYKDGRFSTYTTKEGLYTNTIYQILEDNEDNFWLTSAIGVFKFSKKQLSDLADKKISKVTYTVYGKVDGLKTEEFNTPAKALKMQDGKLYFPSIQGVVIVDTKLITTNKIPPSIVIEDFIVNGEKKPIDKPIQLASNQNKIEINYTALSFLSSGNVKFKYMLVGLDRVWEDVGTKRYANYTNLSPGSYTFKLIACNNDGVWNDAGAKVEFRINSPLWKTWPAIFLYVAWFLISIQSFIKIRTRVFEQRNLQLQKKVQESTRELVKNNEVLQEQKNALEEANLKLQEIDQMKANFTAMLVHDLKSPLAVVNIALELLQENTNISQDDNKDLLQPSRKSIDKILTLVNEVLELYRSESTEFKLDQTILNPTPYLKDWIKVTSLAAKSKDIAVELNLKGALPDILIDINKIERVFSNLLSNAIKFTPNGGKITVEGEVVEGVGVEEGIKFVKFSITDTGEGIPPEAIPFLFDPYKQADSKQKKAGVGLGLAIVKRIVAEHGGSISVSSQLDVGSCFTILLPKAKRSSASLKVLELEVLEPKEIIIEKMAVLQKSIEQPVILLVDDDVLNQKVARAQLKKLNYEVDLASSGEEAIKIFSNEKHVLVFVDYYMTGMTGVETAQQIRKMFQAESTPIVALTGLKVEPEELLDWKKKGITDVLLKPFKLEELEVMLTKWAK